ncbi:MAG: DUF4350 domain-containing protein [Gilvibacter sp.]
MDKRAKRILMAFGVAILLLIVVEVASPQPVDWRPNYTATAKTPLGSFVMFNELDGLFVNTPIERVIRDPYEFLKSKDTTAGQLYVFINDRLALDEQQFNELSQFVAMGNTAFMAANSFGSIIADSLNVSTYVDYSVMQPELTPQLYSPSLKMDSLAVFNKSLYAASFTSVDTTNTTALGYFKDEYDEIQHNYIKVSHGEGHFYFMTTPEAFSNYYLLKEHQTYAAHVLSYFNPKKIYWDEYKKSGRIVIDSKMRFVLTQPALKWAYYVTILGLILFVIFKGKREQRIIELIEPLKNDTKDFTATIGDLHFQYKDYTNITTKRITYFLERVRSELFMSTNELDANFIKRLSLKSGNNIEDTKNLIDLINSLRSKPLHSEEDLIRLNKLLQNFTIH